MRASYALLHVETYEEERALAVLQELATREQRALYSWSARVGLDGQPHEADLGRAFAQIERFDEPALFVLLDASSQLEAALMRRHLKELLPVCVARRQTIVLLGSQSPQLPELARELTRLAMPLPAREDIAEVCRQVVPAAQFEGLDHDALVSGAMGLTVRQAHRALTRVRQQYEEARARNTPFDVVQSILREKQRLIGANDALEFFALEEGVGEVGGLDELKAWLEERREAFGAEAERYGLPAPKGLLLVGVQGCGKSLTAKVVGRHWGLPLLRLDLGRVFDGRRAPEEALRDALQTSEALAPCVLWMDEIEKGFAQDGEGRAARVLGSLLTWLQEKSAPVFLVATANQIDVLPPELLRKGRFDEIFFVDLPEAYERKEILRIHLRRRRRTMPEETLDELAKRAEYFSGSELEQVVVSAMYGAFAQRRELTHEDLVHACRDMVPLYRTYEDQIKALREWAQTRARQASRKRRVIDYFAS